jgi:hypothetical protein
MPLLVRLYVKTAFTYLMAGFILMALSAVDRWLNLGRWLSVAYVTQLHLLVVGWLSQLAAGVAYWMFPRLPREVRLGGPAGSPRGPQWLAWAAYTCLNVGLLLRLAAEPFFMMGGPRWLAALLALSGVLQVAAVLLFGWLIWARIRPMEGVR